MFALVRRAEHERALMKSKSRCLQRLKPERPASGSEQPASLSTRSCSEVKTRPPSSRASRRGRSRLPSSCQTAGSPWTWSAPSETTASWIKMLWIRCAGDRATGAGSVGLPWLP